MNGSLSIHLNILIQPNIVDYRFTQIKLVMVIKWPKLINNKQSKVHMKCINKNFKIAHVLPEKQISESLRATIAQQVNKVHMRGLGLNTLFRFSTSRRSYERLSHHWKAAPARGFLSLKFSTVSAHTCNEPLNSWRHTMASSSVAARSSKYTYRSSGGTSADVNIEYSADLSALSRLEVKILVQNDFWGPTVIFFCGTV